MGQHKKEYSSHYNAPNREEIDPPRFPKSTYEPKLVVPSPMPVPKFSLQQQKNRLDSSKPDPISAPVSTNNSLNNSTNSQVNQTGMSWKSKPNPGQTILTNNEIKEKALQFRSPKYGSNSKLTVGVLTKTGIPMMH